LFSQSPARVSMSTTSLLMTAFNLASGALFACNLDALAFQSPLRTSAVSFRRTYLPREVAVLHYRPLLALHPAGRCDVVMKAEHPDAINGRFDSFGVQARERVCIKSLAAA